MVSAHRGTNGTFTYIYRSCTMVMAITGALATRVDASSSRGASPSPTLLVALSVDVDDDLVGCLS